MARSNPRIDIGYAEIPDKVIQRHMDFIGAVVRQRHSSRVPIAIATTIADEHMRTGRAIFSYNELADRALCTPRNAARVVRRLIEAGFLRVVGTHQNDGNNYAPNLDRGLEVANAAQS
jgi:hypothetical protein